jgi:hypothetical protein
MSTLAAFLRERAADDVRRLEPDERVRLALVLGDDDLRLYCESSGIAVEEARRKLMAGRQAGRRLSASAAYP